MIMRPAAGVVCDQGQQAVRQASGSLEPHSTNGGGVTWRPGAIRGAATLCADASDLPHL